MATKKDDVTYPVLVNAEAVNGKRAVQYTIAVDEDYNVDGTMVWTKSLEIMLSSMMIGGSAEAQMKRSMRILFSLIAEDKFYEIADHYLSKGEDSDLPDGFIEGLIEIFVGEIIPKALPSS